MKKCPPGVICVENYSMFFLIICIVIIFYLTYSNFKGQNITVNNSPSEKIVIKDTHRENVGGFGNWFGVAHKSVPARTLVSARVRVGLACARRYSRPAWRSRREKSSTSRRWRCGVCARLCNR